MTWRKNKRLKGFSVFKTDPSLLAPCRDSCTRGSRVTRQALLMCWISIILCWWEMLFMWLLKFYRKNRSDLKDSSTECFFLGKNLNLVLCVHSTYLLVEAGDAAEVAVELVWTLGCFFFVLAIWKTWWGVFVLHGLLCWFNHLLSIFSRPGRRWRGWQASAGLRQYRENYTSW